MAFRGSKKFLYKNTRLFQARLPVQIVTLLILLASFTVIAISLPSIWLMQRQMDRQAWSSLDQGSRIAAAALENEIDRLNDFARLTAERPSLTPLLENGRPDDVQTYLETLRVGADLDVLMICRESEVLFQAVKPGFQVGSAIPCIEPNPGRLYRIEDRTPSGWLLAAHAVNSPAAGQSVVIGRAVDADMIEGMRIQDEIEIGIASNGIWVAGTQPDITDFWTQVRSRLLENPDPEGPKVIRLDSGNYFARRAYQGAANAEVLTALSVADIVAARSELIRTLAFSILAVVAAASILAFYLSQRLIHPLERLRASAVALSMGDLSTPVTTRSQVREINQVSYALEDARSALQHSLQALKREKEWSEHLLASVVEGIVAVDRQGRITFFSLGAERITDWRSERVLGKHIDDVFKIVGGGQSFSECLPPPGGRLSVLTVERSGQPVTLAITGATLSPPEAGRAGAALVLRDVSEEEALRRLLGDFLANITHEFRTPLSALAASIELMIDQLHDLTPTELSELLDSLRLGTLGLQTLIDNLLEGASIEAGRFRVHPRPTDLDEVVRETAAVLQPLFEKYRQHLALELPPDIPLVNIDPRRTTQVLVNLLSNAIKWNAENSNIVLEVKPDNDSVCLSVSDRGPGIPADHLTDVYTRFAHLNIPVGRTEYGAGLGLSVVKAIVEAQGGRVGVENRPGGGARFWFTVPFAASDFREDDHHVAARIASSSLENQ